MPFEIAMPQLGLTMEQGSVVEWHVPEGAPISEGQEVLTVETDKSAVAVQAPRAGILARILVPAGETVPVGTCLAVGTAPGESLPADWLPGRAAESTAPEPAAAPPAGKAPVASPASARADLQASWKARSLARDAGLDLGGVVGSGPAGRIVAADVAATLAPAAADAATGRNATPVALNLAAALGLDLGCLQGTGPQGKITQTDVLRAAAAIIHSALLRDPARRPPTQAAAQAAPQAIRPQVASTTPLTGVRKIVSQAMADSVHTSARVALLREVDAGELARLRELLAARGVQVSYNDLLVQICAVALREHPAANARLGEGQIEHLDRINIGLAVDTDRGLLVPVIHNADRLTTAQIAAESARLIQAARQGRSLPDDLSGGVFTITNLGMLGVDGFTPVINLPECCILGVGRIVRKPVVVDADDTVAVRPMMTLSLVFDHRVLDGAPAARFLGRIAQLIQDPLLLLAL
jgi:pyruvate dehydrogenase E2 component (dihydrolipoamide acetyltransferase)